MAPNDTFVYVIVAALIITGWLGSRKFLGKQSSDPMRETAAKLKSAGFIAYPTLDHGGPRMYAKKHDTPIFSLFHHEICRSCGGKVYVLGRYCLEDEDGFWVEYVEGFGIACPHCDRLEKAPGYVLSVPAPLRDRWIRSADLPDFFRRVAQRWN